MRDATATVGRAESSTELRAHDEVLALIRRHRSQVVALARPFRGFGVPAEDLESEGVVGLLEAIARFDPTRGTEFATYASWWILKRIRESALRNASLVRLPRYRFERLRRVLLAQRELLQELSRPPSAEEIGRRVGLTSTEVDALRTASPREVSFDDPIGPRSDLRIEETVADQTSHTSESRVLFDETVRRLRSLLELLPQRYREVLDGRYGLNGGEPRTLAELARSMALSRERVHQIEREALRRLRVLLTRRSRVSVG